MLEEHFQIKLASEFSSFSTDFDNNLNFNRKGRCMGQESWTVGTRVIGQDQNQSQRGKIEQTGRVMPTRLALDQDGQTMKTQNSGLKIQTPRKPPPFMSFGIP